MNVEKAMSWQMIDTKLLSKRVYFESNLVWRRFIDARKFLKNQDFPVFQKLWRKHSIPIECYLV